MRTASQLTCFHLAPVEDVSDEESGDIPFRDAPEERDDKQKDEDKEESDEEDDDDEEEK